MRKIQSLFIFAFCFILATCFFHFISAGDSLDGLQERVGGIQNAADNIRDADYREQYLKTEWTKVMQNSKFGQKLLLVQEKFQQADPIWETIFGLSFTFSWLFFLTLFIWIFLLDAGNNLFYLLEPFFPLKIASKIRWISFFVFVVLISTVRIPKWIAILVVSFISGKGEWYVQLTSIVLFFVIIILVIVYMKKIRVRVRLARIKRIGLERTRKEAKKTVKEELRKEAIKKKKGKSKENEEDEEEDITKEARAQAEEDLGGAGEE